MADAKEASERLYARLREHGADRDYAKRVTSNTEDRSARRQDAPPTRQERPKR
jgi:hypothetical protein